MKVSISKVECPKCRHEFDYEYETLPFPFDAEEWLDNLDEQTKEQHLNYMKYGKLIPSGGKKE